MTKGEMTTTQLPQSYYVMTSSLFLFCLVSLLCTTLTLTKEIEATSEWQLLGENETIAAGLHVRMNMTSGEKWVKLADENESSEKDDSAMAAVVQPNGSVHRLDNDENADGASSESAEKQASYDYEMMHRTLSKLPKEEIENYGGLPELPEGSSRSSLTSEQRIVFEDKMAKIWEQRQADLRDVQEQLLDVPQVLKERMRGMKDYLKAPLDHLKTFRLDDDEEEGFITHIISLLKDLEFQLIDVDNARDFHTMGGWEILVALLSEDVHTQNKTLTKLSRSTEEKIRAIQAHAAWTIGTAVKNTGEFYPFAVEPIKFGPSLSSTTALDMLLELFCKTYKEEESWPIRTLLGKGIYAIGALLRGNRLAQAALIQNDGAKRLGKKLHQLVETKQDMKLIQRLISLAGDLITDVQLDGDVSTAELNESVVESFTTQHWCDAVSAVLRADILLPIQVQETVMNTASTIAVHCTDWKTKSEEHKSAVRKFWSEWEESKHDFDIEHLNQLKRQATQLRKVL